VWRLTYSTSRAWCLASSSSKKTPKRSVPENVETFLASLEHPFKQEILVADPEASLEWLAKDRASARLRDLKDIDARRPAFVEVVRQWIKHV
jgi:hypothetical protein